MGIWYDDWVPPGVEASDETIVQAVMPDTWRALRGRWVIARGILLDYSGMIAMGAYEVSLVD